MSESDLKKFHGLVIGQGCNMAAMVQQRCCAFIPAIQYCRIFVTASELFVEGVLFSASA